jgi:glutathione S-transferase
VSPSTPPRTGLELFGHPFSSYTWKALIAFYETETPFTFRNVEEADNQTALAEHWPVGKFPLLVEDGVPVIESSIIIEHVAPAMIPEDRGLAEEVRLLDRIFDNHVMTPMQAVVAEHLPFITQTPDEARLARARAALDKVYPWLDSRLAGRRWAAGEEFTLADCAGAPSLFYADWVHPIPDEFATLKDYRGRVLARPSVARAVDEARPYRHLFPLGAPDRD